METGVDITEGSPHVGEDTIFLALGKVFEESLSTLSWALKNFQRKNFCIIHIHKPAQRIRVMGVKFRVEGLDPREVKEYHEMEKKKMHDTLNEYIDICLQAGVRAEAIYIEKDNKKKGIVALIAQHGITKLVMGAAADKHYLYSRITAKLKSKNAIFVNQYAPVFCHIWFVCKNHLIATREGDSEKTAIKATIPIGITSQPEQSRNRHFAKSDITGGSAPSSPMITVTIQSEHLRPGVLAKSKTHSILRFTNPVQNFFIRVISRSSEPSRGRTRASSSSSSSGGNAAGITPPISLSQNSSRSSSQLSIGSSSGPISLLRSDDEIVVSSLWESIDENLSDSSPANELSLAKESESLHEKEKKGRKEQLVRDNKELEKLKSQRDQVLEELRIVQDQRVLSAAQQLVAIQKELDELQELRKTKEEEYASLQSPQFFSVFSALDIELATEGFNPSLKIGEGGYGKVYKGLLRQTPVAIKRFRFHSLEEKSSSDFQQEVDVMSKVRHPNLVTLIGACPEACSLVYEYLPNGSLEDRLTCKDGTPPLSWKTRMHIAMEICSALIFLHSNVPQSIVHGDLKPDNILLDANFVSKLGDFGLASFLPARDENSSLTATLFLSANPKGTIAYIDPEFFATGVLTAKTDVYSFGIVLLRLLTGRAAIGISKEVQSALDEGTLNSILDASAGDWPLLQAKQLAQMALRCCEWNRKDRPNELEVWNLLRLLEIQM